MSTFARVQPRVAMLLQSNGMISERLNGMTPNQLSSLEDAGVRGDLFQVGRDIWPVPDQEAQSQEFANAIRAALLVLGSQDDGD